MATRYPVTIQGRTFTMKRRYAAMSQAMALAEAARGIYSAACDENWGKLNRYVMDAVLGLRELNRIGDDGVQELGTLQRMAEEAAPTGEGTRANLQALREITAEAEAEKAQSTKNPPSAKIPGLRRGRYQPKQRGAVLYPPL